ncbi:LOW QUALITY PROTEIN: hypothetical protein Ct61P_14515 [Colletotrichum tofieldiae]|nr:LOW QUALITY PROTEIN: hypothetical protein Ct61P_14515 [Colletotrichum tofieldiae]
MGARDGDDTDDNPGSQSDRGGDVYLVRWLQPYARGQGHVPDQVTVRYRGAILKNSPHPEAAKLLHAFTLLLEQQQAMG